MLALILSGLLLAVLALLWLRSIKHRRVESRQAVQALIQAHVDGAIARQRLLVYYLLASKVMEEEARRARREWWYQ